ncbi:MAG: type II toxin-antitoxin system VapC family toxin [Brevinematia bacterium]
MRVFIDTSSLVKRYIKESGSEELNHVFDVSSEIFVSPITKIEFHSAIERRLVDKSLSKEEFQTVLREFKLDYLNFEIVKFDAMLELLAIEMIRKHRLRTLDSIQLTSAKIKEVDRFITSDEMLYKIAKVELDYECVFIS